MARKSRIRPMALCVFRHNGRILVARGHDRSNGASFYRPLGGGIDFGETGAEAVVREINEELGQAISAPRYLGALESVFRYRDKPRHELLLIFDADFLDPGIYEREHVEGREGQRRIIARWLALDEICDAPLVPEGLSDLLQSKPCR
ncbi:MAG: NUDIX hydrolase [Anaerolineaceae bacterium]|nr:NUDIX hydrolase [Anaerolineaceae bacterium]